MGERDPFLERQRLRSAIGRDAGRREDRARALAIEARLVTERGPGVMELRIALTNVEPTSSKNNAAVKDAATAVSVGVATSTSVLEPSLNVGKLSIEGEILDSVSTQVDVAFMSSNAGRRYFNGLAVSQSWGDIDDAFKSWTRGLCESLDRAHKT